MECRILLVAFPGQSHINPALQLAKHLLRLGAKVTLSSSLYAIHHIEKGNKTPRGLALAPFSDGYDDGQSGDIPLEDYYSELTERGSKAVEEVILNTPEAEAFTNIVYTTCVPWACNVGKRHNIPCTLAWCQPAMLLTIYYYHFHGLVDFVAENAKNPSYSIHGLPGLEKLTYADLPSFLKPSNPHKFAVSLMKEHVLQVEDSQNILTNTFTALDVDALGAINELKHKLLPIGPLIPSAFLGGKDPSDTCFGGDQFQKSSSDYVDWLNKKPESSVIYVAFGSLTTLSIQQCEEIARGLLESGLPFLWVMRAAGGKLEAKLSRMEELEKQGMIVPWCDQVEVLSHPSVGCFVTHCGWNSSLEGLCSGVPMVGMPQWADQNTNAKCIQDIWKTGVTVNRNSENDDDLIRGDEIKRCVEIVMGSGEMKKNAKKWRVLAREAFDESGSSTINLKAFVDRASKH